MDKEIEVYNTYFGDCIMLKEKDSNLLIDFGIHFFSDVSSIYGNRNVLMSKIADDISNRYSTTNTSLLITHFHEDHVSGLIYMYKSGLCKYKNLFKNIYIPNIWNNPFAVASNILEGMIVENELRRSGLPRTTASLFDVLDFISTNVYGIKLLSKGVTFENDKYITLWPIDDDKENRISEIIQELGMPTDFEGKLLALSEIMCIFVTQELLRIGENSEYFNENYNYDQRIEDMKIVYNSLLEEFFENMDGFEEDSMLNLQKEKLNKLDHKYNIVFQNKLCGDENVLFTGDIEVVDMKKIAIATDIKLHPYFKYIKVPHHGTERHYFDYLKYNPRNVIITNGKVNTKDFSSYKICKGYGLLKVTHLCTNSNNCCNCSTTCGTGTSPCSVGRKLVYSDLYETI